MRHLAAVLSTLSIALATSPLGAAEVAGTWCDWTPREIPDADAEGVTSTIAIATGQPVAQVDFLTVYVAIEHTYVADLSLELSNPAALTRELASNPGPPPCVQDDLAATFGDFGFLYADQVCDVEPRAIHGLVKPNQPFYLATPALLDGNWTLTVRDTATGDAGTLRGWCVLSDVLFYDGFESRDVAEWSDAQP